MSTPYHDILADIGLRVNSLYGPIPADLQTNYNVRPLTTAQFLKAGVFPFSACISALCIAEQKLANTMASTSNPTLRSPLASVTAALASGASVPATDAGGASIIGVLGSVRDSEDFTVCNEKTLEEITRRNRNAGSFYRLPMYAYKFDGDRIYHTQSNVLIDCCVYDREVQLAAIEANSDMLLPDTFGEALVCGGVAALVRDDEEMAQAEVYAAYFQNTLTQLAAGLLPVPSKVIPGPTMTAFAT